MIYSITFNPSLDLSATVEDLIPNEKSYVEEKVITPGGNGINAGIIAARMGGKVSLGGFLGGNNGESLRELLLKMKMNLSFIKIKNENRMNITIGNKHTHKQTRLSFEGPEILPSEWKKFKKTFESLRPDKDIVILGGSLPPGITIRMIRDLIKLLKRRKIFCMVDLPAKELKSIISSRPDFIKPNLEEFHVLTGSRGKTIREVYNKIQKLQKYIPLICVSSVEGGAMLVQGNEIWFGKTPRIKIRTSVGAGDSMVGAMAYALSKHQGVTLQELLRFGLSASSATLTEPGLSLGSSTSIQRYYKKISIRRIIL